MRRWSVRHARGLEAVYRVLERVFVALDPLWRRLGYQRIEAPVALLERVVKGFLFDCQMCGQCALSATGMSCSMTCPKNLRNGPCGGVAPSGKWEADPGGPCAGAPGFQGHRRMPDASR